MTKLEIAVDQNPNPDQRGRYGIIMLVGGSDRNVHPIGDQSFSSPDAAVTAFCRAVGQLVKAPNR
jgi:hypothetical protein